MNGKQIRILAAAFLTAGSVAAFGGCEPKGPAEKAGENIDQGVKNVKDSLDPRGPAEKAGAKVDNVLNK